MAVALDSNPATNSEAGSVTTLSFTGLTITAAGDTIVAWLNYSPAVSSITMTWGSQSLTQIISAQDSGALVIAELWGRTAPTTGNQTLTASWTGTASFVTLTAVSFKGANQTGGTTTFKNSTSATGSIPVSGNASVSITTATTDAVVAGFSADNGTVQSVNNTEVFIDATTTLFAGNFEINGASPQSMTATIAASCGGAEWVAVGCDIAVAAGGSTVALSSQATIGWRARAAAAGTAHLQSAGTVQTKNRAAAAGASALSSAGAIKMKAQAAASGRASLASQGRAIVSGAAMTSTQNFVSLSGRATIGFHGSTQSSQAVRLSGLCVINASGQTPNSLQPSTTVVQYIKSLGGFNSTTVWHIG